ncbi:MAG: phosphomannose isomerase type II C-terminal cupin domain [Alphaproteobacteria bacterium]|nr:phosphomannose isomerase type II C-terminal cupin domain [Alphaproteobacteria bacterium]
MKISYQIGQTDSRPWGKWEVLSIGKNYIIKKITVKPSQILSLQAHTHRAEHWFILKGKGKITLDNETFLVKPHASIYIDKKQKHRIKNTSNLTSLVFIEIQIGNILDENDIIRFEDTYGRL